MTIQFDLKVKAIHPRPPPMLDHVERVVWDMIHTKWWWDYIPLHERPLTESRMSTYEGRVELTMTISKAFTKGILPLRRIPLNEFDLDVAHRLMDESYRRLTHNIRVRM